MLGMTLLSHLSVHLLGWLIIAFNYKFLELEAAVHAIFVTF